MDSQNKGGGQNLKLVKIKKARKLQLSFLKRRFIAFNKARFGVFKKARELATLCGVDVAVIVSLPGGKMYSSGSPSAESVIQRFLSESTPSNSLKGMLFGAGCNICELNRQLTVIKNLVELEKRRGEELKKVVQTEQNQHWFKAPIEELNLQELEQLKAAMVELKEKVAKKADQLVKGVDGPSSL